MQIGIVGLPNVGKSTLFNALLKRQVALAANYPFATIEPNVGVVDVPDKNLDRLAEVVRNDSPRVVGTKQEKGTNAEDGATANKQIPEKIVPATIKFYDIAGLVKGASQGEGLGNKFLSHIREVDAIVQVVRDFSDANIVREGSTDPKSDIQTINTELILSDLSTIQSRIQKHQGVLKKEKSKDNVRRQELYELIEQTLDSGQLASSIPLIDDDLILIKDLNLLTLKPMIYVLNVGESDLASYKDRVGEIEGKPCIYLSAKIESELSALSKEDQEMYMLDLGIEVSGLDTVIQVGYKLLGLQTFYTAGPKEVRAWTIEAGTYAPQAAGKIHTDFEKGFVKAMVVSIEDLVSLGSYKLAKDKGLIRMEGKEYVMQVGDVVEFRVNP